jgi:hypothetical protein
VIRMTPVAFILTFLLPWAVGTAVPGASLSIGVMCAAMFWIVAALVGADRPYMLYRSDGYFLALPLSVIVLLSGHIAFSSVLVAGADFGRFAGSCAILLVLFTGAHFASKKLLSVPGTVLVRAANLVLLLLAFCGLAGAAGAPALGPAGVHDKPLLIFGEPSHFALAMLPLLLFRMAVAKTSTQILLISSALAMGAVLQNLTMIAGILVVSAVLLRQWVFVLLLIPAAGAGLALDLTYYAERLAFSSDSHNLSTLVFLQGWQNAFLNFGETHGFGVGFQQFGVAGSIGEIAQRITRLLGGGATLSLLDGGTTASKLIAEFGVLGILLILLFLPAAARSVLFIRRSQFLPPAERDAQRIFFCAMLTTYTIELFMRGVGYFSPGGFLAVVSLLSLSRLRRSQPQSEQALTSVPEQTLARAS